MSRMSRIAVLVALVVSIFGIGAPAALAKAHHHPARHHAAARPHGRHGRRPAPGRRGHHAMARHARAHHRYAASGRRHRHAIMSSRRHRGHVVTRGRRHRYTSPARHAAIHRRTQLCQQVLIHGAWVSRCR
jgi:hypothetical protein